ncbi:toxin-antitoxin system toxin subunit [Actinomyces respiraculi]|uniref:Toxin-antitoxin system toxin subunit n=1 Tax=Actinomyces respiraculi TaxID=2744574 RepID=A0A7T0LMT8_9ACTO|nr:toxin-antitoxin system toxin subunit [Actinomyces respiraculi]
MGFDGIGRVLEIVTVVGDDGQEVVIHAMRARRQYLPGGGRS